LELLPPMPIPRDFCLHCGRPFDPAGRALRCPCGVTPHRLGELECKERADWQEYERADYLAPWHLNLHVATAGGSVPVMDMLRTLEHADLVRELPVRVRNWQLVQLIYQKGTGSRLVKWDLT
jgi:hypothetical protein